MHSYNQNSKMRIPFHIVLLPTGSIGHFVQDYEKVLFEIDRIRQRERFVVFFLRGSEVCNLYFLRQLTTRHRFLPRIPFIHLHRVCLRLSKTYRQRDQQIDSKSDSVLKNIHTTPIPFLVTERDKAVDDAIDRILRTFGMTKYVCLVARDLGFDRKLSRDDIELQKQAMRITPINSFLPTIKFLNQLGFLVIRLGRHNDSRLESDCSKLAFVEIGDIESKFDDIADFQVIEKSTFLISTGSGIDCVGLFYRKPVLYVNLLSASAHPETPLCPVGLLPYYYDCRREIRLTFDEVTADPISSAGTSKLRELGISIIPKGPAEILNAVDIFVAFLQQNYDYRKKLLLY